MNKVQNEKARINKTLQSVSKLLSDNHKDDVGMKLGRGMSLMRKIVKEDELEDVKARLDALKAENQEKNDKKGKNKELS